MNAADSFAGIPSDPLPQASDQLLDQVQGRSSAHGLSKGSATSAARAAHGSEKQMPGESAWLHLVASAVRTRFAAPDSWASNLALLVRDCLLGQGLLDGYVFHPVAAAPTATFEIIVEATEPGSGRCIEVGVCPAPAEGEVQRSAPEVSQTSVASTLSEGQARGRDSGGRTPAERLLMQVTSAQNVVCVRVIFRAGARFRDGVHVEPAPPVLDGPAEAELRLLLTVACESLAEHVLKPDRRRKEMLGQLTEAQRRIFLLVLEDLSEREISERVERSPHTIHDHVRAIYATFGVSSRAEVLAMWYRAEAPQDHEPV